MVDIRSENKEVKNEIRNDLRLEFHCDAKVLGIDGIQTITDISLGGIFIETNILDKIRIGQILSVNTKLPTDRSVIRFKAKVVHKTNRGIGCQFISLDDQKREAICLCFEMFRDTLPAECEQF
ncbi:MAG: PilZ domain-containing protein [Desulfobacterales bacterium]|nr:PilZ domain-containing protein [Desulfobacterales bacterium]